MMKYPIAKKEATPKEHLGQDWVDNYTWLEDIDKNPKVRELIDQENDYFLKNYPTDSKIYQEILTELKEKVKEEDQDVPEKIENYFYYSRSLKDKEYELHCRKKDNLENPEEIYFDENKWAEGHEYFDLGALELDSSHQRGIACIDTQGDEIYEAYELQFDKPNTRKLELENLGSDIEWCNKSSRFYYLKLDKSLRPFQCYRYDLETNKSELIFQEDDPEFFLGLSATKDEKYILIETHGSISSEIHYLDANDTNATPKLFSKREKSWEYYLGHHEEKWVILSNHEEKNFKLYVTEKDKLKIEDWECIVSGTKDLYLSDFEVMKKALILFERINAQDRIRIYYWETGKSIFVDQPEECYHLESGDNSLYEAEYFNYIYSSMTQSSQYTQLNLNNLDKKILKTYEVPKHYDSKDYECKRLMIESRDGKHIPISLLWNKKFPPEKANLAYVYAYGAYGYSMDCSFDRKILSLTDRGVLFVQVHARGGSDLGRSWYEDGKFLNKKNTFYDVNDCANYISTNYPNLKNNLLLSGGSAGGLMVGACINLEPETYKAAVLNVPFVDVVNTMLDESQALTALEYDEWGDPRDEVFFNEIKSYSPYDNIKKTKYPTCLSIAGLSDQRVRYWEALKYTQKLRDYCTEPESIFLYTNTSSGHAGSSGRYEYLKEVALEFAFVLNQKN